MCESDNRPFISETRRYPVPTPSTERPNGGSKIMLFFGKKEKSSASEEKKAALSMPKTKKVQFMPVKIPELTELLRNDIYELTRLEPVNYYASKDSFLQCTFFCTEDYAEVYFVVGLYDKDILREETPYFKADYDLMKKTVIRFGQRI